VREEVFRSEPRTLDELEKQIRGIFAVLPAEFIRQSVESVSHRLHNCV
jgi:hypothetical protein